MWILNWLPAIAWAGLIFFLSHQSRPPGIDLVPSSVGHFVVYGVLSLTLIWGFTAGLKRELDPWRLIWVFLLATAYGVTDEIHQSFVPGRHPSIEDVLTNAIGALVFGTTFYWFWNRKR